ncbi:MAG: ATP-binding protein [Flavobacteriia bacterium]|nr:ATP-binding protein [Flavobacteriia bacterium]
MDNKLNINVRSFSYKNGIPADPSGNGGGFVFDCRGILNPGRFEEYKRLTGRDEEVIEFLETKTKIHEFLDAAYRLVDLTIQDYLNRGFTNLEVNFGCTGGQHRSVYSADRTAEHLTGKFSGINITVEHVVQDGKNWKN